MEETNSYSRDITIPIRYWGIGIGIGVGGIGRYWYWYWYWYWSVLVLGGIGIGISITLKKRYLEKLLVVRNAAIEISGIKKLSNFRKTIHRFRFYDSENVSSNFMKYQ